MSSNRKSNHKPNGKANQKELKEKNKKNRRNSSLASSQNSQPEKNIKNDEIIENSKDYKKNIFFVSGILLVALCYFWFFRVSNVYKTIGDLQAQLSRLEDIFIMEKFSSLHFKELLWSFRSHLYFGLRTRTGNDSLMFGLSWFKHTSLSRYISLRHVAKSEDNINIRWEHNDGYSYGKQILNDTHNDLQITLSYLKQNDGHWAVRAKGNFMSTEHHGLTEVSLIPYLGIDQLQNGVIRLGEHTNIAEDGSFLGPVHINGYTPETDSFTLVYLPERISQSTNKNANEKTFYSGINSPEVWKIEEKLRFSTPAVQRSSKAQLLNQISTNSNIYLFQKILQVPFEVDIVNLPFTGDDTTVYTKASQISSNLENLLEKSGEEFEAKFEKIFPINIDLNGTKSLERNFAMSTLSNLLGGTNYFYGNNRIFRQPENPGDPNYIITDVKKSLYTATPSRIYFPRGFVWDEGFHQLVISQWKPELSYDIIAHWLQLVNDNGWIAREQILGAEAESRVPSEFIVQFPDHGNPPTFYLPLQKLLVDKENLSEFEKNFLKFAFKNLLKNFIWWLQTQYGERTNSWRWRGDNGIHTFTCGLDDYPRFSERSTGEEHVDLLCWMIFASSSLEKMAQKLQLETKTFHLITNLLTQQLEQHWNYDINLYSDYNSISGNYSQHIGYVNLFPLIFGLIPPNSPRLAYTLDIIENKSLLFTNYGLRSLSSLDPLFGKGENYWRGPIWVNINYLVLRSLKLNYLNGNPGPYTPRCELIYQSLRQNLVKNIFKGFKKQKDIFENYDSFTGRGQGQHPFAGWTSLVVLIMSENYV